MKSKLSFSLLLSLFQCGFSTFFNGYGIKSYPNLSPQPPFTPYYPHRVHRPSHGVITHYRPLQFYPGQASFHYGIVHYPRQFMVPPTWHRPTIRVPRPRPQQPESGFKDEFPDSGTKAQHPGNGVKGQWPYPGRRTTFYVPKRRIWINDQGPGFRTWICGRKPYLPTRRPTYPAFSPRPFTRTKTRTTTKTVTFLFETKGTTQGPNTSSSPSVAGAPIDERNGKDNNETRSVSNRPTTIPVNDKSTTESTMFPVTMSSVTIDQKTSVNPQTTPTTETVPHTSVKLANSSEATTLVTNLFNHNNPPLPKVTTLDPNFKTETTDEGTKIMTTEVPLKSVEPLTKKPELRNSSEPSSIFTSDSRSVAETGTTETYFEPTILTSSKPEAASDNDTPSLYGVVLSSATTTAKGVDTQTITFPTTTDAAFNSTKSSTVKYVDEDDLKTFDLIPVTQVKQITTIKPENLTTESMTDQSVNSWTTLASPEMTSMASMDTPTTKVFAPTAEPEVSKTSSTVSEEPTSTNDGLSFYEGSGDSDVDVHPRHFSY